MMMTASSRGSCKRMSTRCHGEPLTETERPFEPDSASAMIPRVVAPRVESAPSGSSVASIWDSKSCCSCSGVSSAMSSAGVEREEERMKVADTDVISRTVRMRWGVHGRMECHDTAGSSGWSDICIYEELLQLWIRLFVMST